MFNSIYHVVPQVGSSALTGVIGSLVLPVIGYGSISVAAGSLGLVAASCATGMAIVFIPTALLMSVISTTLDKDNPITSNILKLLLCAGAVAAAVFIGAAIFGAMANPIGLCLLAGIVTGAVCSLGLLLLGSIIAVSSAAAAACDAACDARALKL